VRVMEEGLNIRRVFTRKSPSHATLLACFPRLGATSERGFSPVVGQNG